MREKRERLFPTRLSSERSYTPSARQMTRSTKFRPCSSALTPTFDRIQVHARDLSLV